MIKHQSETSSVQGVCETELLSPQQVSDTFIICLPYLLDASEMKWAARSVVARSLRLKILGRFSHVRGIDTSAQYLWLNLGVHLIDCTELGLMKEYRVGENQTP
mmetsp:Transcript_23052/g.48224  ORF Transcript_23052/g.48224 Transcript_23052/m.48224 type:complete len:104 (-) Transcript_23052:126-437(-)